MQRLLEHDQKIRRCQKIVRHYLNRKRAEKWLRLVATYKETKEGAKRKRRYHVWNEIINSEKTYLERLIFVNLKYKRPLQDLIKTKDEILTEQQIACVFGFLEEVKTISKQLLTTMTQIVQPTTTGAGISNIFIEKIQNMQDAYCSYVVNFDRFLGVYKDISINPKFKEFEDSCKTDTRSSQLTLPDFLVMPIQRPPRYKMLFQELKALTPEEDREYPYLVKVTELLEKLCITLNERKKKVDGAKSIQVELPEGKVQHSTWIDFNWTVKELTERLQRKFYSHELDETFFIKLNGAILIPDEKLVSYQEELLVPTTIVKLRRNKKRSFSNSSPKLNKSLSKSLVNAEAQKNQQRRGSAQT
jgi:hypothetical protein